MRRTSLGCALLVTVGLLAACAGADDAASPPGKARADLPAVVPPQDEPAEPPTAAPGEPPAAEPPPAPEPPAAPAWVVGASPLPLRPDGFGQVLPTPEVLRDRRLPTADLLPPPPDGRFASTVGPVTPELRSRMGESWSEACPVALKDLRYLTVSFVGFDDRPHTGEIVVAAEVSDGVIEVFRRLFEARFPIEEMRLITTADLQAPPTGDGNNTAGYVCRAARGQTRWSAHALGLAVDINPFHNPMTRRDLVLPELAGAYADRAEARPGMHLPGGPAVRAFADLGWTWGGTWRSSKDYMHFSATGT
jgi:hypothetical protein